MKKNKIAIVFPITSVTKEIAEQRVLNLSKYTNTETQIGYYIAKSGPESIECRHEVALAVPESTRLAKQAEQDGYDAVIIWCADDPGVHSIRELVHIPVIGPGEASLIFAHSIAKKYSILTPYESHAYLNEELAAYAGLDNRLVSVRGIEMSVLEMRSDRKRLIDSLYKAGKCAIEIDHAQALAYGCLGMSFTGEELSKLLGVPVVEPAYTSVVFAESMIKLGYGFSTLAYASSPKMRNIK